MSQKDKQILEIDELKNMINQLRQEKQKKIEKMSLNDFPFQSKEKTYEYMMKELDRKAIEKQQILEQSIKLLQYIAKESLKAKNKIKQLEDNLLKRQQIIEQNARKYKSLQKNNQVLKQGEERLNKDIIFLGQKIVAMKQSYTKQKTQLKTIINEEKSLREIDYASLENLGEQNQNLKLYLSLNQGEKSELKAKVQELQEKVQQNNKKVQILTDQLDWKQKKRQELEEEVKAKQDMIDELEEEIESLNHVIYKPFEQMQKSVELQNQNLFNSMKTDEKKSLKRNILSVQLPHDEQPFTSTEKLLVLKDLQLKKVNSSITEEVQPVKTSNIKKSNLKSKMSNSGKLKRSLPDPYYCHFVLLSQSIKIRENRDSLFGINVKPFYKEIIQRKIPMHEWQVWIKEKLIQAQKQRLELQKQ